MLKTFIIYSKLTGFWTLFILIYILFITQTHLDTFVSASCNYTATALVLQYICGSAVQLPVQADCKMFFIIIYFIFFKF